jgi:hypothetical protein
VAPALPSAYASKNDESDRRHVQLTMSHCVPNMRPVRGGTGFPTGVVRVSVNTRGKPPARAHENGSPRGLKWRREPPLAAGLQLRLMHR